MSFSNCSRNVVPEAWLKHRVDASGPAEDELPPGKGEMDDAYVLLSYEGKIPFGYVRAFYPELIAEMRPGDEFWWFRSPTECWDNLAGRAGYCIVQDGKPLEHVTAWKS